MRQESLDKARADPRGTAAKILDAAGEAFAEAGFQGASTRDIAKRAGVPFGAVHYHWGSKRQLWQAAFKRAVERLRDGLGLELPPDGTPSQTVDALTGACVDLLADNRIATRLLCRAFLDDVDDPHVQATIQEMNEAGRSLWAGPQEGATDPAADLLVLSCSFVAVLASENAQRDALGGDVFTSPEVRERLRRALRALAGGLLRIP